MRIEQFQREKDYGAGIAIAKNLLKLQLITSGEYRRLESALIQKYSPVINSLRGHNGSRAPISDS